MPHKIWVVGEEVLASQWNQYVQEQVVATFATAGRRAPPLSPRPRRGEFTYLADVDRYEVWSSTAWVAVNIPRYADAAAVGVGGYIGMLAYNVQRKAVLENGDGGTWRSLPHLYPAPRR